MLAFACTQYPVSCGGRDLPLLLPGAAACCSHACPWGSPEVRPPPPSQPPPEADQATEPSQLPEFRYIFHPSPPQANNRSTTGSTTT